jgi:hypothetical protein
MKTFSTTEAKNRFGEFLDAGMVEGVKLVRNNRVIGYFLPEREYDELRRSNNANNAIAKNRLCTATDIETLSLYSQGKITASEAKVDLVCDFRELITLLNQRGLPLPRLSFTLAEKMAAEALALMDVQIASPNQPKGDAHHDE